MGMNFSELVYLPAFNTFARPISVMPLVSQPDVGPYDARGILDTKETDVLTENGAIFSDSHTILDIRIDEFPVLPMQGDRIYAPPHAGVAGGTWQVEDLGGWGNAGGEITITLKRVVEPKP